MYTAGRWLPVPLSGAALTGRSGAFMVYYKEALYVFGGYSGSACSDWGKINLKTLSWETPAGYAAIPSAVISPGGALVGSRVYLFAGDAGKTIYSLDLENIAGGWAHIGSFPSNSYGHTACALGGRIFIVGGTNTPAPTVCLASNILLEFTP